MFGRLRPRGNQRLQRSLSAEIDERARALLRQRASPPLPLPHTRNIAVKVINHCGDEVLKVHEV